jgi:hypothetical protein
MMTIEQITGYLPAWMQRALAWAHIVIAVVGAIAAVCAATWGLVVWAIGPITPKTQTDIASLYEKMVEVQTNTAAIKVKLDELPRPYEFDQMRRQQQEDDNRLSDLTAKVGGLAATVTSWVNAVPRNALRKD